MKIEEMKAIKAEMGLSYEMIAKRSGVSLGTVKKIFGGYVKSPRYETMIALENFFSGGAIKMQEEAFAYYADSKKQGEFTIADVERIPEEIRVELIDGKLYYLAAPSPIHQILTLEIAMKLRAYIDAHGGECEAGIAATDFKLNPADDKTMVQPDVFVICDTEKLALKRMIGAPDLAIEILSPSNSETYRNAKLIKYRDSGVREYWMVDYDRATITTIDFNDKEHINLQFYSTRDRIPVRIFEGFEIDFSKIDDYVQNYIAKCEGREG